VSGDSGDFLLRGNWGGGGGGGGVEDQSFSKRAILLFGYLQRSEWKETERTRNKSIKRKYLGAPIGIVK